METTFSPTNSSKDHFYVGLIISWQIDGETMETERDLFWGAPKSLQMVSVAMKFKEACSLEEKLWPCYTAY